MQTFKRTVARLRCLKIIIIKGGPKTLERGTESNEEDGKEFGYLMAQPEKTSRSTDHFLKTAEIYIMEFVEGPLKIPKYFCSRSVVCFQARRPFVLTRLEGKESRLFCGRLAGDCIYRTCYFELGPLSTALEPFLNLSRESNRTAIRTQREFAAFH